MRQWWRFEEIGPDWLARVRTSIDDVAKTRPTLANTDEWKRLWCFMQSALEYHEKTEFEKTEKPGNICHLCHDLLSIPAQQRGDRVCPSCRSNVEKINQQQLRAAMSECESKHYGRVYEVIVLHLKENAEPEFLSGSIPLLFWAESEKDAERKALISLTIKGGIKEEHSGKLRVFSRPFGN